MQRRAAHRRGAIVQALAGLGVTAAIEGEAVRLSGHGLARRWMRELPLREAGRGRE
ncbi:hypothetical protein PMI04_007865 [Sphingobium sp. AP49]|uniref:hypothetical protein n=1 Tax=Sphingobium sp. AP49 TaxID=1144307 RepID=UPI0024B37340|nr:hypothetical protein [Sphingobium sp. AP49]WHO40502.1 hypothetical protein PMI04_007865 [Sphingobium sp. AP49]